MKPYELLKIAIRSIRANKVRSLLTMLGLIIGISSVVTILSIGDGTETYITNSLGSLGTNNITLSESRDETIRPGDRIDVSNMVEMQEAYPELIEAIAPVMSENATLMTSLDDDKVVVKGSTADSAIIDDLTLTEGRFLSDNDVLTKKTVAVIDSDLKKELYGDEIAVGKFVAIDSGAKVSNYTIVGVYLKEESNLGASANEIYTPYSTLDKVFNLKGRVQGLSIKLASSETIDVDSERLIGFMERLHKNEGLGKYEYFSMGSVVDTVSSTLGMVTLLITAVAGISLVVGGIGVMNIMLVSVTERTREIGVRKALGAKRKDILMQFLVEAVIICLIGGIIGVGVGFALTEIAEILFDTPMALSWFSVALSTVFSSAVGLLFGVYPANKASKLDPIESLRYE